MPNGFVFSVIFLLTKYTPIKHIGQYLCAYKIPGLKTLDINGNDKIQKLLKVNDELLARKLVMKPHNIKNKP